MVARLTHRMINDRVLVKVCDQCLFTCDTLKDVEETAPSLIKHNSVYCRGWVAYQSKQGWGQRCHLKTRAQAHRQPAAYLVGTR